MELSIASPAEGGFTKEIKWNNEELKAEIAAKMAEYKGIVFTEENIREAKADRSNLRRLKEAFEAERKRIKKLCMEPYERFEAQVREVTALIDEPIRLIDAQIKEAEEQRRGQKRKDIESMFESIGFQSFVSLDMIFDERWLNATMPLGKIEEQMRERMFRIGQDVLAISQLPEFSFEAMENYKRTLDVALAIQEGQRLSDIQKRKAEHEEQRRAEESVAARQDGSDQKAQDGAGAAQEMPSQKAYTVDFRVTATQEQLERLKAFLADNGIQYGPVPRKGE